jgi:hypothetical protein
MGHPRAAEAAREMRGTPYETLFTFIRMFAPELPPAFRGVMLTLDNLVTLLKTADDPPEAGRGVLDAVLDGTLAGFPEISAAFGAPLEEAMEETLKAGGALDVETLVCGLSALQDPDAFLWGSAGPPRGVKALAFALKAGRPLLAREWWERNVPPDTPFPQELLNGPMNSPETYGEAAKAVRRMVAAGEFVSRKHMRPGLDLQSLFGPSGATRVSPGGRKPARKP